MPALRVPSILVSIFISFYFSTFAVGSELDPYTFRDIELKDSSAEINFELNRKLNMTVDLTNSWMDSHRPQSEEVVARVFKIWQSPKMGYLYRLQFKKFVKAFFIGHLESCITTNNCQGWNKFERILLYPGESVFDDSDYNLVTKTFLAPVINLCGHRVGADKLTHFQTDGLQYFKGWMQGIELSALSQLSLNTETAGMGQTYTEVISSADHHSNMDGLRFYRTFFEGINSYLAMGADNRLVAQRPINICEFVSKQWDETQQGNENLYNGLRAPQLIEAIGKRLENSNPKRISKHDLMNRTYKEPPMWDQAISGGLVYAPSKSIKIPVAENSVSTVVTMPDVNPSDVASRKIYIRPLNP